MTRRTERLPAGYKIETVERFIATPDAYEYLPTLYRWEIRTTGRWWWKRSLPGWYVIHAFPRFTDDLEIIDYAHRYERSIQCTTPRNS